MISIQKFLQLNLETRLRKLWRFSCQWEEHLRLVNRDNSQTTPEIGLFLQQLIENSAWPSLFSISSQSASSLRDLARIAIDPQSTKSSALYAANDLRHALAGLVGKEAAEWDLFSPFSPNNDSPPSPKPDFASLTINANQAFRLVFCDSIRSPFNIGSIFRTAEALGFSGVVLSPECPSLEHPRLRRSAMGALDWLPSTSLSFSQLLSQYPIPAFAIELGGTELDQFSFPLQGIAVLGSEEMGVHPEILSKCRQSGGIVTIPLPGYKASLNVGVSFGIIAATWPR